MLSDAVRTLAFERALQTVIEPHQAVLDFGCGSGILAFFAHRAGAARVYAVESSPFIGAAEAVARANHFDRIEFLEGEDVSPPTPVHVIVSEWMGHFVFNESMLEPLIRLRDRVLLPGGTMVPRRLSLWAGVLTDPASAQRYQYFDTRPYGIDFSPLSSASFARSETRNLKPEQVARTVIPLGELDMLTCRETPQTLAGSAVFPEATTAYGLAGWFDADLAEGVQFGTGPFSPKTHWHQMVFPLSRPFVIEPGRPVEVQVHPVAVRHDRRHWRWSIRQGDRVSEEDEMSAKTWMDRRSQNDDEYYDDHEDEAADAPPEPEKTGA